MSSDMANDQYFRRLSEGTKGFCRSVGNGVFVEWTNFCDFFKFCDYNSRHQNLSLSN